MKKKKDTEDKWWALLQKLKEEKDKKDKMVESTVSKHFGAQK